MTREDAIKAWHGQTFHYTGRHDCKRETGPRGGIKETVMRVRVSGTCQTWKTRPADFRLPVKYGLYESGAIDQGNAAQFHKPEDCPAGIGF